MDDDPAIADALQRLARRAFGSRVPVLHAAYSPTDALFTLDDIPVDADPVVVIMDYQLRAPRSGADVLAEMARRRPGTRRVLISAFPRSEFEHRFPELGLAAFVTKPWDTEEMRRLLLDLASPVRHGPGTVRL